MSRRPNGQYVGKVFRPYRLANGNLMVLARFESDTGIIACMVTVEIGPDHPRYADEAESIDRHPSLLPPVAETEPDRSRKAAARGERRRRPRPKRRERWVS